MLGKLEDKLVEKCRESNDFAWIVALGGILVMIIIAKL